MSRGMLGLTILLLCASILWVAAVLGARTSVLEQGINQLTHEINQLKETTR